MYKHASKRSKINLSSRLTFYKASGPTTNDVTQISESSLCHKNGFALYSLTQVTNLPNPPSLLDM